MLMLALCLLAQPEKVAPDVGLMVGELQRVQAQIGALRQELFQRTEALEAMKGDVASLREEMRGGRDRTASAVAAPFLSAPPPPSDSLGVAKTAIFAPRLEIDAPRRHDTVTLRVRRMEAGALHTVAEVELQSDATGIDIPVDQNGALYVLEWSTAEGQVYNLVLRDGASGQPAASAPVKALQSQGRFVFVAYRLD
jgi:hypothetical protein